MTNISLDLRNKLPAKTIAGLLTLKTEADRIDIPILMVGATAREIVLRYQFGIVGRATRDIDFGISVGSWNQFGNLKSALVNTGYFQSNEKYPHQLESSQFEIRIDIVPFGDIETSDGIISWENDCEMNVSGFTEAHQQAIKVSFADNLILDVVSPTGLALLKLVSWSDRKANRDAEDFWLIAGNYLDLGNYERLFEELMEFLGDEEFDNTIAGALLLGRDIKKMLNAKTELICNNLFGDPKAREQFTLAIHSQQKGPDDNFDRVEEVLKAIGRGLEGLK